LLALKNPQLPSGEAARLAPRPKCRPSLRGGVFTDYSLAKELKDTGFPQ